MTHKPTFNSFSTFFLILENISTDFLSDKKNLELKCREVGMLGRSGGFGVVGGKSLYSNL